MTVSDSDIKYMRRALELAALGMGSTSPNPMVGAVIVAPDGRIIGEGWHRRYGSWHAEVNTVNSVAPEDRHLLRQSSIYVTLEPCSHYGKTPPCSRLIIDTGMPRVVVGAADPFREVAGRGVAMLRQAGIEVIEGVLADESRSLNAKFITAHEQQRPFVTLKWAQSADGFIDSDRPQGHAEKFSTRLTSLICHRQRALHDAILTGSGTILADHPRLDCRLWSGRSPRPVVVDRRGRLTQADVPPHTLLLHDCDSIADLLARLYAEGITSVLVEGGAQMLQSFIDSGLWDQARVETVWRVLGAHGTVRSPRIDAKPSATVNFSHGKMEHYANNLLLTDCPGDIILR